MLPVICLKISINSLQQDSTQDSGPQESEVSSDNILTVAKDPRYARYLKMVQVVSWFGLSSLSNPGEFPIVFQTEKTANLND